MSNSALAAIIQVLDQAGIDHMVAGSFASGYHGAMRTTHDIDLIVDTDEARLRLLDQQIDHDRSGVAVAAILSKLEWAKLGSSLTTTISRRQYVRCRNASLAPIRSVSEPPPRGRSFR
jgi:hypothetical protein